MCPNKVLICSTWEAKVVKVFLENAITWAWFWAFHFSLLCCGVAAFPFVSVSPSARNTEAKWGCCVDEFKDCKVLWGLLCVLLWPDSMASAHRSQNCKGAQNSRDYKAKRCPLAVLVGTYLSLSEEKKSTYVQRAQWREKRGECTMFFFFEMEKY